MAIIAEHFYFSREGEGQMLSVSRELVYAVLVLSECNCSCQSERVCVEQWKYKWLIILINRLWMTLLFMEFLSFSSIQLWLQSTNSHSALTQRATRLMKLNLLQFKIFASWWQINSIKKGKQHGKGGGRQQVWKRVAKFCHAINVKSRVTTNTTKKCHQHHHQQ